MIIKFGQFLTLAYSREYLLYTNVIIGAILMIVGEIVAQSIMIVCRRRTPHYSRFKLLQAALIGMMNNYYQHFYYLWVDYQFPEVTILNTLKKVALDEILMAPSSIALFFIVTGIFEKLSIRGGIEKMKKHFFNVFTTDMMFFPFVQFLNFQFVPGSLRMNYISLVNIIWNTFLCYVDNNDDHERRQSSKFTLLEL